LPSKSAAPAFGQADLSNCEREQIHLAGSIQPHGALLVLRERGHVIVQASVNAAAFLGLAYDLVGRPIDTIEGDFARCIGPHLDVPLLSTVPLAVRCRVGPARAAFDVVLHRPPHGGLVVELERAGPRADQAREIEDALRRTLQAPSLRALSDETARIFRGLTGYDRVMVYRFDEAGHGEVLSEEREPGLEPYLGNRYPATDIPQIARRLYERNRVRVLVDINYAPVPLAPDVLPDTGQPLDMSLCALRSVSPIHVQYLKNMGVGATLVVSLMVGGRLWGLVSCHHYVPRAVPFETRTACELLAEAVGTRIAALESFVRGQADIAVRRLEQRLIETIPREGDWRNALFGHPQSLLQPVGAAGVALLFEGQAMTAGEVPGTLELRRIGAWLDGQGGARTMAGPVISTMSLGRDEPEFAALSPVASGLVAAPLSAAPGEYLIWFRPEQVRTVTWGGDPTKTVPSDCTPFDLSPRRSFAQWHEVVRQTSEAWTEANLAAARLIGSTVQDVILQFRSVGLLIAQDQLNRVQRQVQGAEAPVVVADAAGRILLANDGFRRLLPGPAAVPETLADLPSLFADPPAVQGKLRDLLERRAAWRGDAMLAAGHPGPARPVQVRADPVFSAPGRVTGFVLLFTDLTEQRAADAARQRFQERIFERERPVSTRLDAKGDLLFQALLSHVVENAQLAALEITDGGETARMPEMLESVRASVTRTRRVLEHLIWHAGQGHSDLGQGRP
jgi:light-regulated signal transduction histidine kinase (bacteriophytochrome)